MRHSSASLSGSAFEVNRTVRILVHAIAFPPEPVGSGPFVGDICDWLAEKGHQVNVVCPPPYYPQWKTQSPYRSWEYRIERNGRVSITRCPVYVPPTPSGLKRMLWAMSFAASSIPVLVRRMLDRPDVVLTLEPCLIPSAVALLAAKCCGAKAWLHIHDFEVDMAVQLGHFRGAWLSRMVRRLESRLLRQFDVVSTISGQMIGRLDDKSVVKRKQVLLPNWIDTSEVWPISPSGEFRKRLGIPNDLRVALYSGTLNPKQGLETVIECARHLQNRSDLLFVICGNGVSEANLRSAAAALRNVRFLPLQPRKYLNELLNLADIHLLPQRPGVADLVLPSKLLGMLACGGAIVATTVQETAVAEILADCGVVVPPDNQEAFTEAVVRLVDNPDLRERLGRTARLKAERLFDRAVVLTQFECELQKCVENSRREVERSEDSSAVGQTAEN